MTGRTHLALGAGSTALVLGTLQYSRGGVDLALLLPAVLAAAAGSLAPDLDHPGSIASLSIPVTLVAAATVFLLVRAYELAHPSVLKVGLSALGPPWVRTAWSALGVGLALFATSWVLGSVFGHRGAVHSVAFGLGVSATVALGLGALHMPTWWAVAFAWGWCTHLLGDLTTPAGLARLLWPLSGRA